MDEFRKILNPGSTEDGQVFVKIEWVGRRLSMFGVIGPKPNGDSSGPWGQIATCLRDIQELAPGRNHNRLERLIEIWERWHLNDLRPYCPHQYAEGWHLRPIDPSKPLDAYGKHFEGQRVESRNMLGWIPRSEHPAGLLGEPCPTCGYRYGTAWLHEDVPEDILEWLKNLPETTRQPAWV